MKKINGKLKAKNFCNENCTMYARDLLLLLLGFCLSIFRSIVAAIFMCNHSSWRAFFCLEMETTQRFQYYSLKASNICLLHRFYCSSSYSFSLIQNFHLYSGRKSKKIQRFLSLFLSLENG